MRNVHRKNMRSSFKLFVAFFSSLLLMNSVYASSDVFESRKFTLNQNMIEELSSPANGGACNPSDVMDDLLKQIGPVVKIFPTENYYYFQFYKSGKSFSGSIRLAVNLRDSGVLQFVCFQTYTSWIGQDAKPATVKNMTLQDGLKVTKIGHLKYNVKYRDHSVDFLLNALDQKPVEMKFEHEKFVGRVFDESGLVFQLIYNSARKSFYFALDPTAPIPEAFVKFDDNVIVGKRTGFVFYRDSAGKHILIAVNAEEVYVNSWNDGPFDQLPENFYTEIGFWDIVFDAYPKLRGKVDSGGVYKSDADSIFAIWAYREYLKKDDLSFVNSCSKRFELRAALIECLTGQSGYE